MQIIDNLHGFFWDSMTQNNCNTYLIDGPTPILVDPGHLNLFGHVREGLQALDLDIGDMGLVLSTHAHPDHLEAVQLFKETSARIAFHEKDWELAKTMMNSLGAAYRVQLEAIRPHFFLQEGSLSVNGTDFEVFHTPGHAPGAICLYWPEKKALFTGDLIFKEGLGRTDLPGGNGAQLKESIKRLSSLDVEWILPGHGGFISGAESVKRNFQEIESFWFAYV